MFSKQKLVLTNAFVNTLNECLNRGGAWGWRPSWWTSPSLSCSPCKRRLASWTPASLPSTCCLPWPTPRVQLTAQGNPGPPMSGRGLSMPKNFEFSAKNSLPPNRVLKLHFGQRRKVMFFWVQHFVLGKKWSFPSTVPMGVSPDPLPCQKKNGLDNSLTRPHLEPCLCPLRPGASPVAAWASHPPHGAAHPAAHGGGARHPPAGGAVLHHQPAGTGGPFPAGGRERDDAASPARWELVGSGVLGAIPRWDGVKDWWQLRPARLVCR